MKRIIQLTLIVFLALILNSCFDINEKITVNADKSGEYRIYVENSGLAGMLAMASGNEEFEGVINQLDSLALFLSKREGITRVTSNFSPMRGDMFLDISFEKSKYLNKALFAFAGYEKFHWLKPYMKIKHKKFKRMNISPFIEMYLESEKIEVPYQEYLAEIMLRTEVIFPAKVKATKGENLIVNENKVNQTFSLTSLLNNKKSTKLIVKYNKM